MYTELNDIDGDDTFSMYHAGECDDTITDASCMEHIRPMTDRSYYSKPLKSDLKPLIRVDFSSSKPDDSFSGSVPLTEGTKIESSYTKKYLNA